MMYSIRIYGASADPTYFSGSWDAAVKIFTNTDLEICGHFEIFILIANRQIIDNRQQTTPLKWQYFICF